MMRSNASLHIERSSTQLAHWGSGTLTGGSDRVWSTEKFCLHYQNDTGTDRISLTIDRETTRDMAVVLNAWLAGEPVAVVPPVPEPAHRTPPEEMTIHGPVVKVTRHEMATMPVADLLVRAELCKGRKEARRIAKEQGFFVVPETDPPDPIMSWWRVDDVDSPWVVQADEFFVYRGKKPETRQIRQFQVVDG